MSAAEEQEQAADPLLVARGADSLRAKEFQLVRHPLPDDLRIPDLELPLNYDPARAVPRDGAVSSASAAGVVTSSAVKVPAPRPTLAKSPWPPVWNGGNLGHLSGTEVLPATTNAKESDKEDADIRDAPGTISTSHRESKASSSSRHPRKRFKAAVPINTTGDSTSPAPAAQTVTQVVQERRKEETETKVAPAAADEATAKISCKSKSSLSSTEPVDVFSSSYAPVLSPLLDLSDMGLHDKNPQQPKVSEISALLHRILDVMLRKTYDSVRSVEGMVTVSGKILLYKYLQQLRHRLLSLAIASNDAAIVKKLTLSSFFQRSFKTLLNSEDLRGRETLGGRNVDHESQEVVTRRRCDVMVNLFRTPIVLAPDDPRRTEDRDFVLSARGRARIGDHSYMLTRSSNATEQPLSPLERRRRKLAKWWRFTHENAPDGVPLEQDPLCEEALFSRKAWPARKPWKKASRQWQAVVQDARLVPLFENLGWSQQSVTAVKTQITANTLQAVPLMKAVWGKRVNICESEASAMRKTSSFDSSITSSCTSAPGATESSCSNLAMTAAVSGGSTSTSKAAHA
eukprot:GSA120T00020110001.1